MKKGLQVVGVVVLVGLLTACGSSDKSFDKQGIDEISYTTGNSSANITYDVKYTEENVSLSVDEFVSGESSQSDYTISKDEFDELVAILNDNNAYEWKDYNESSGAEGAQGFNLYITGDDFDYLAYGNGEFPDGYDEFAKDMDDFFAKIVDAK